MSRIDLEIQDQAERDIADIFQYTLQQWGEDQLEAYWSTLWDAFDRIRQFPDLGRPVDGLSPNIREHILRHHPLSPIAGRMSASSSSE